MSILVNLKKEYAFAVGWGMCLLALGTNVLCHIYTNMLDLYLSAQIIWLQEVNTIIQVHTTSLGWPCCKFLQTWAYSNSNQGLVLKRWGYCWPRHMSINLPLVASYNMLEGKQGLFLSSEPNPGPRHHAGECSICVSTCRSNNLCQLRELIERNENVYQSLG